jgi:hypothetical protein
MMDDKISSLPQKAAGAKCKMAVGGIPFWILANGKSVVTG